MKINENINLVDCGSIYDEEGNFIEWDDSLFEETMKEFLKESKHYLVFAYNCRWNGASGYKFATDYTDCVYRSYDTTLIPVNRSRGKKVLVCTEYSHDVPLGATTLIVALTDKEYDLLRNRVGFNDVEDFADDMLKGVATTKRYYSTLATR